VGKPITLDDAPKRLVILKHILRQLISSAISRHTGSTPGHPRRQRRPRVGPGARRGRSGRCEVRCVSRRLFTGLYRDSPLRGHQPMARYSAVSEGTAGQPVWSGPQDVGHSGDVLRVAIIEDADAG
jgi:hypothetical protein